MTRTLPPRCGRVMRKYEAAHGPLLDDVVCGRPEGHNGLCWSEQAIANRRQYGREHWAEYNRRRKERRKLKRLFAAVDKAAEDARWSALGPLGGHAVPADPPPFDPEDQLP